MGKLRVLSGRDVCKILAQNGFREIRQRGSHVVMQKREADSTITVPVPDHQEIRIGTLLSIIRQSQLPRSLLNIDNCENQPESLLETGETDTCSCQLTQ